MFRTLHFLLQKAHRVANANIFPPFPMRVRSLSFVSCSKAQSDVNRSVWVQCACICLTNTSTVYPLRWIKSHFNQQNFQVLAVDSKRRYIEHPIDPLSIALVFFSYRYVFRSIDALLYTTVYHSYKSLEKTVAELLFVIWTRYQRHQWPRHQSNWKNCVKLDWWWEFFTQILLHIVLNTFIVDSLIFHTFYLIFQWHIKFKLIFIINAFLVKIVLFVLYTAPFD